MRHLRTPEYNELFGGDPTWITESLGGMGIDGRTLVTRKMCIRDSRYIVGVNNMYFPSATIEMIGYLTLTLIASLILRLVEKLMDGSDSYELAQGDQLVMAAGTYSHPDRGTPFDEANRQYTCLLFTSRPGP